MKDKSPAWDIIRLELYLRCGGKCEFCGDAFREGDPYAVHHRKLRAQGGGNEMANLALIHGGCHEWAHRNPARAYELGWMVHGWDDPAKVTIFVGVP
jgi:5-methylcytosine-specific restriction endonuclease McrA